MLPALIVGIFYSFYIGLFKSNRRILLEKPDKIKALMKKSTINQLNQLNQKFYSVIASEFSQTRQHSWVGWEKLLTADFFNEKNRNKQKLFVLDLGCGNGRFAEFLSSRKIGIKYLGIDTNEKLLKIGLNKNVFQDNQENLRLEKFDLIENLLAAEELGRVGMDFGEFDLVVAFGVLHHLPSFNLRRNFLKLMAKQIHDDGLVVITAWRFDRDKNLMARKQNFTNVDLSSIDMEENDYLLDWQRGQNAIRYCHLTLPNEMKELADQAGLKIVSTFSSDGKSGNLNDYYLCKREN